MIQVILVSKMARHFFVLNHKNVRIKSAAGLLLSTLAAMTEDLLCKSKVHPYAQLSIIRDSIKKEKKGLSMSLSQADQPRSCFAAEGIPIWFVCCYRGLFSACVGRESNWKWFRVYLGQPHYTKHTQFWRLFNLKWISAPVLFLFCFQLRAHFKTQTYDNCSN